MKILYHLKYLKGMGADRFIYEGYKHAWEDMGHQLFTFIEGENLDQKITDVKPDLFFASLDYLRIPDEINIIKKFRKSGMKVFLGIDYKFDRDEKILSLLKDSNFVDIFFGEKEPESMLNFKKKVDKEYYVLPNAADPRLHFPTKPVKKYAYDIVFLGARLPQKEWFFKKVLLPLTKKYRVGIFGPSWTIKDNLLQIAQKFCRKIKIKNWADFFNQLRITVPLGEENQLYSSAKISLNAHEREEDGSQPNYILNQRTFKIPACGGFEICDYVPALRRYFAEDEMIMALLDPKDWFKKIDYYLRHEKERKLIQEKGTARVLRNHTYRNRIEQIINLYNSL